LTYDWYPRCTGAPSTATIAANSNTFCTGDTINFFNIGGKTPYYDVNYKWQVSSNPGGPYTNVTTPPSGTLFAPYTTIGAAGTYFYVMSSTCPNSNSTTISNEIAVTVYPLPVLDIVSAPAINTSITPIETCAGETYTLTAVGANTYDWMLGPTTDSYVVQPAGNPSYTVTGYSTEGCVSSKTIEILVNPIPVLSIVTSPSGPVCPGMPVAIGAGGTALTYTWVAPQNNAFLITVTPTVTTVYTVIATTAEGCTNIATQQVVVRKVAPIVAWGSDNAEGICKGEKVTLSASGAKSYTWTSPGSYATGAVVNLFPQSNSTYTVSALDTNGCATSTMLTVQVQACTGLDALNGNTASLDVYPNPSNGVFTIELNNGVTKTIEVIDFTGKTVITATSNEDKTPLSINELANGIYYLRVQSINAVQMKKIIKQ